VRPNRSRAAVTHLLEPSLGQNNALRADSAVKRAPPQLNAVLETVARQAHHDHLVIIISDFDGQDEHTRDLLMNISLHNDVIGMLVFDPFLFDLPPSGDMVVSDGELQVELPFGAGHVRKSLSEAADARIRELLAWRSQVGMPVPVSCTAEAVVDQVRKLLGGLVGRSGGR